MKKIVPLMLALALSFPSKAQTSIAEKPITPGTGVSKVGTGRLSFPSVRISEGENLVNLTDGSGSLKLTRTSNDRTTVVVVDLQNRATALKQVGNASIDGNEPVVFMSSDKKITVSIAKTTVKGYYRVYLGRDPN